MEMRTKAKKRLLLVVSMVFTGFLVVTIRLSYVMIAQADKYLSLAKNLHQRDREIKAPRGNIYDRNGVNIASKQKAQEYLAQYQEVETMQDLRTQIMQSVESQRRELANFSSILDKLVDQTEHFQKINPLTPIEFEVEKDSEKFGLSLGEMNLWQNTGATVVAILQNAELIVSPGPYATLNQGDTLYFVGASDTGQIVQNFFYGN